MKIIDAAPELMNEIVEEMEVTDSRERNGFVVHIGHHPTMGRVVVISGTKGEAVIVEIT